jgi:DinB superfamily
MNPSLVQCRYLLSVAELVFANLDDSHRALEPRPGMKTAGWLVGHLAVSGDFARVLCGRAALCPPGWRPLFNPGSEPSGDPNVYPAMAALCDAFRLVYADLLVATVEVDPSALSVANPFPPARAGFPTSGDFVAYLMSSHLAYHLGQLVAWRNAAGFRRPRRPDALAA